MPIHNSLAIKAPDQILLPVFSRRVELKPSSIILLVATKLHFLFLWQPTCRQWWQWRRTLWQRHWKYFRKWRQSHWRRMHSWKFKRKAWYGSEMVPSLRETAIKSTRCPAISVEVNTLTREQIRYTVLGAPSSCCQLAAGLERLSHASFQGRSHILRSTTEKRVDLDSDLSNTLNITYRRQRSVDVWFWFDWYIMRTTLWYIKKRTVFLKSGSCRRHLCPVV